jgi:protein TonB
VSKHFQKAFIQPGELNSRSRRRAVRTLVLRLEEAMSHELFEEITAPAVRRTGSRYTIPLSIAAHVVVIATFVIVPLFALDVLPSPPVDGGVWVTPTVPVPPPPPPAPRVKPLTPQPLENVTAVSYEAPKGIHEEIARASSDNAPTVPGSVGTGGLEGSFGNGPRVVPPPPIQPKPLTDPLRVGGQIREPRRVFSVAPVYPAIARQARVPGTVLIQAVIGVDGAVRDTQVLNSVPLLDQAALDAVRQWKYQPTLLNGVPVAVIMTVSVRFTLE